MASGRRELQVDYYWRTVTRFLDWRIPQDRESYDLLVTGLQDNVAKWADRFPELSYPMQFILQSSNCEADWNLSHTACFQAVRHTAIRYFMQGLLCFDHRSNISYGLQTPFICVIPAYHYVVIHLPIVVPPSVYSSGVVYVRGTCRRPLYIPAGIYDTYQMGVLVHVWNFSLEPVEVHAGTRIASFHCVENGPDQADVFELVNAANRYLRSGVIAS
jgi:hypothetical protein